jgi:hypothetical protein
MNNQNRWLIIALISAVASTCILATFALSKDTPRAAEETSPRNAKNKLPISARLVASEGKTLLEVSPEIDAKLASEIQVKITVWSGADSTEKYSLLYLLKNDAKGFALEADLSRTPQEIQHRLLLRLPELLYVHNSYDSSLSREYLTFLPGDVIEIKNTLFQPIVIQCQPKTFETSKLRPDLKGPLFYSQR